MARLRSTQTEVLAPPTAETWRSGPLTERLAHGLACAARELGREGGPESPVSYLPVAGGWRFLDVATAEVLTPDQAADAIDAWLVELSKVDGYERYRDYCWRFAARGEERQ